MTFEPFKPWHLLALDPLGLPESVGTFVSVGYGKALVARGPAYTAWADSDILLCGGIARDDSGQGWLWSFVAPVASRHFLTLHRYVVRFLSVYPMPLKATTEKRLAVSCRWLELLGFERTEDEWPAFIPGGSDHYVYRRG